MKLVPISEVLDSLSNLLANHDTYEPEVTHHFSDGVCIREMRVKAGSIVIGALHKTNHITISFWLYADKDR